MKQLKLFSLLLILFNIPLHAIEKLPILHINADQLSALQIGLEIGYKSKVLFSNIEQRYDTHLSTIMTQSTFNKIVENRLSNVLQKVDSLYKKELEGIAAAWSLTNTDKLGDGNLSWNEYQVLNLLPDVGLAPNGSGISVFGNVSANGSPIIGRNVDWINTPDLRSLQAITVYHYTDTTIVNIGFAGISSIINGFNEQGLFLALFNSEPYSPYMNITFPKNNVHSSVFELRKTLETQTSVRYAARYLLNKNYSFNNNILISDKNSTQILEQPIDEEKILRSWNSSIRKKWRGKNKIAVVDCFVSKNIVNNCEDTKDNVHWQRLLKLSDFNSMHPATVNDISAILFDTNNDHYEIFNKDTLSSIIYLPAYNSLYLYSAVKNSENENFSPVRQIYLNLISNHSINKLKENKQNLIWIIWLILAVISSIIIFVFLTAKKNN